jgi:hypothetical protein
MATTIDVTSSYDGTFAGEYISDAILSTNSLTNGVITVKPNILGTRIVKRLTISDDIVQDASCDFASNGTVTIDERKITPKLLKINLEDCKQNYIDDYEVANMGNSAWKNYPKAVSDAIIARSLATGMAKTERNIWSGIDAAGQFEGFETLARADVNVVDVVTPVAITAANVIDELTRALDTTLEEVREMPGFQIAVSPNIFNAYVRALGGFMTNLGGAGVDNKGTTWFQGGESVPFEETRVVKCKGMSSNTMFLTYPQNLEFGTALLADHNKVKVIDMEDNDGSENVRFIARYSSAVQYGFGGDIVFYDGSLV